MGKKQKMSCRTNACPGDAPKLDLSSTNITARVSKAKRKRVDPEDVEVKGLHMNVRDLGNDSGQVKPQLKDGKSSYSEQQMATARSSESKFSKLRARKKK